MKKYILSILLFALPIFVSAYDVKIDGIYYNLNSSRKTAEVTFQSSDEEFTYSDYSGFVNIPEKFNYEGADYAVSSIGNYAFADCISLTSVTIPRSVTCIGINAFEGCSNLTSVHVSDLAAWCNIVFGSEEIIDDYFSSNPLFYAHHLYDEDNNEITNLVIPEGVVQIKPYAFSGCEGLISVTIPNSVNSIGICAFEGCSGLTSVTINSNNVLSKDYVVEMVEEEPEYLSLKKVFGPQVATYIVGDDVTRIGNYAFADCTGLTSVTIGKSIKSIGGYAFYGCNALTSVHISDIASWCDVNLEGDDGGFPFYSTPLYYAHHLYGEDNTEITNLVIPEGVIAIKEYAFYGCERLTSVTIPSSVRDIDRYAFYGCSGLTSVHVSDLAAWCNIYFGDNPPYQPLYASSNPLCYAHHLFGKDNIEITKLVIPEGVYQISNGAFSGCSSLVSLTIPNSVTSIRGGAFEGCSKLEEIYCYAENVPSAYDNCYTYDESFGYGSTDEAFSIFNATLYVPAASLNAYKSTSPWSSFGTILPIEGYVYNLTYLVDGNTYSTYTLKEGDSITPETIPTKEGYTFSGWSEILSTMPARDVTIKGTFTVNKYKLSYMVDGEEYKSSEIEFGSSITAEDNPTKEGYTFSGWSEIPSTMPANDVTISGTFTVNKYTITYMVDDALLMTEEVAYGSTIAPPKSQKDGYDILWSSHPTTMPAYNITIYGTYTTGIVNISQEESERQVFTPDGKRVKTPQKGLNIIRTSDGKMKKVVVK